jgi:WD40 repeat protein
MVASAANKDVFIWNVRDKRTPLLATFTPHSRPVSDLCWALSDPNVLATCSADMYVNLWDVRTPASALKLKAFCAWTAGATMVKWNRRNPRLIASVHEGEVFIWDVRKESAPITKITAHKQISSMDWSYHSETQLVTSSTDRSVKFWDYQHPTVCQAILQTGNPVSKVKFTPFGRAIITTSQRADLAIRMWSLSDLEQPLIQFMGHKDVISALDWRTCDIVGEDYEYQLLSWSKDSNLRFWPIDISLINAMQAREAYGAGRSVLPSASTSLTRDGFGSSLGIYPSTGTASSILLGTSDANGAIQAVGSPARKSLGLGLAASSGAPLAFGAGSSAALTTGLSAGGYNGTNNGSGGLLSNSATQSFDQAGPGTSSSTITNLEQELAMLQKRPIQGVLVENHSLSQRTIQIRIGRFPYLVRLKITFPSMYPNFATPSFEFPAITEQDTKQILGLTSALASSPSTSSAGAPSATSQSSLTNNSFQVSTGASSVTGSSTQPLKAAPHSLLAGPTKLTEEEKFQLILKSKHVLSKVAYAFVSINLVCIYPCCIQLLELLESFHTNPSLLMQPDDHDQELNIRPEDYYKSFSLSSNSVPSTPSKFDEKSQSLASSSSTLSSSFGKDRSIPRLTFSEANSGGTGATASTSIAFSPPIIKPHGLPTSGSNSDLPLPKTKSDMNLSRFLDNEYLHSSRTSLSSGQATHSGVKLPASQSASNLTSLSEPSSEMPSSTADKSSTHPLSTTAQNGSSAGMSNASASDISHPLGAGHSQTSQTSQSNSSHGPSSHLHSSLETGSEDAHSNSTATRTASFSADLTVETKSHTKVSSSTSAGSATASSQREKPSNWSNVSVPGSESQSDDKTSSSASSTSGSIQTPRDATKQVLEQLGEDYLSNPVPSPRTFGAVFFSTGQICAYGLKSKMSSTGTISANKVANGVRSYNQFLEVLSATGKRAALHSSYNEVTNDESFQLDDAESHQRGQSDRRSGGARRHLAKLPRAVSMSAMTEIVDSTAGLEEDDEQGEESLHKVSSEANLKAFGARNSALRSLRSDLRVEWFDSIAMYDLSILIPVSPLLARLYTVVGTSAAQICASNAQAAKNVRRKDLVKTWSLIEAQTHPSVYPGLSSVTAMSPLQRTWALHPLGRKLLHSVFANYERMRDVQTLAILSCVIEGPATPYGVQWHIPPPNSELAQRLAALSTGSPGSSYKANASDRFGASLSSASSTMPSSFGSNQSPTSSHSHHRSSSLASAAALMGGLLGNNSSTSASGSTSGSSSSGGIPASPYASQNASSLNAAFSGAAELQRAHTSSLSKGAFPSNKSLAATHIGLPRDKSADLPPPPTMHAPHPPSSNPHQQHHHHHHATRAPPQDLSAQFSLLDPERAQQYNKYRRTYAEMLYMWGEYSERAQILKYVADPTPPNDGIDFVILCDRCAKPLKTPYCQNCRIYGFNCDICHLRVKGMSTWCLKCGHGGHADHLKKWFATESVCASGCGCVCMERDG